MAEHHGPQKKRRLRQRRERFQFFKRLNYLIDRLSDPAYMQQVLRSAVEYQNELHDQMLQARTRQYFKDNPPRPLWITLKH